MSTMGLSDRRLPKNLRVRNSAFVSAAHIVVDKECAATGRVGGGDSESVVLQAATSHWVKKGQQGGETAKSYIRLHAEMWGR